MSAKYLCTCMKGFVCVFDTYDKKCKRIGKSCVSQNEVLEDKTSLPHIQFVTTLQYSSQPHNQLFHSRHPQCDIVAHSRRQEIDVNRKRRFTVVVFHSCMRTSVFIIQTNETRWLTFGEDKQSLNDRLRERLAIQGVEQRVYPPFQIINKAFLLGLDYTQLSVSGQEKTKLIHTGVVCFKRSSCSKMTLYVGLSGSGMWLRSPGAAIIMSLDCLANVTRLVLTIFWPYRSPCRGG